MNSDLNHWKELYRLSMELKKRKPWEYLSDCDFLLVDIKNRKIPILISVMGNGGECYGISVHPTIKSVKTLVALFEEDSFVIDPLSTPIASQEALTLYFGDRDEVSKEQYQVIKDLGLKFRGRNNWVYFKSFSVGEIPRDLNDEEVLLLTLIYKKLLKLVDFISEDPSVIESDVIKARRLLDNNELETLDFFEIYPTLQEAMIKATPYENDLMLHKLKQCPRTNDRIELTYVYPEVSDDKVHFIPFLIGASQQSGMPIIMNFIKDQDKLYASMFQALNDYIIEAGRPKAIHVRLEDLTQQLADYCQKLGIMLMYDPDLEHVTQLVTMALYSPFENQF